MKTVPAVPRLLRMGSRPPAGLGLYRPPVTGMIRDANGKLWPRYDLTKPHYDGSPCGDHCLPFGTPDGPMRWLNEPDPTRPPPLIVARPSPPPRVALRGYSPWASSRPPSAFRPPAMGELQRWTCPNGDSVVIPAIHRPGLLSPSMGSYQRPLAMRRPPAMGGIQRWSCPNGANPGARCATSSGVSGCIGCAGMAGGCEECPCRGNAYATPTTVVGPGRITPRGFVPSPGLMGVT